MPFTSVFAAPNLSLEYDSQQDCLLLTLCGQLGITAVQDIVLEEISLLFSCPTWCLVQDNMTLACTEKEVADWLFARLLPFLHQAGVKHWTWVRSPTLRSYQLAEQLARRLPQLQFTLFDDLEHAATWLRKFHRVRK